MTTTQITKQETTKISPFLPEFAWKESLRDFWNALFSWFAFNTTTTLLENNGTTTDNNNNNGLATPLGTTKRPHFVRANENEGSFIGGVLTFDAMRYDESTTTTTRQSNNQDDDATNDDMDEYDRNEKCHQQTECHVYLWAHCSFCGCGFGSWNPQTEQQIQAEIRCPLCRVLSPVVVKES